MMSYSYSLKFMPLFSAFKEICFVKRTAKHLLKSYSIVRSQNADLSGRALYKEVLLYSKKIDSQQVDLIIKQAEDSTDYWTSGDLKEPGFRQIVHFLIVSMYLDNGHQSTTVSFRDIVYTLIPADL